MTGRAMIEAEQKLKDWIKSQIELAQGQPDRYLGFDWFQLTPAEQDVFELKAEDMIRAVPIFEAFEAIAEIAHNDLYHQAELCAALREAYPWITQGTSSEIEFRRFAALFDLEQKTAAAFYWKHMFWQVRQGLINWQEPGE